MHTRRAASHGLRDGKTAATSLCAADRCAGRGTGSAARQSRRLARPAGSKFTTARSRSALFCIWYAAFRERAADPESRRIADRGRRRQESVIVEFARLIEPATKQQGSSCSSNTAKARSAIIAPIHASPVGAGHPQGRRGRVCRSTLLTKRNRAAPHTSAAPPRFHTIVLPTPAPLPRPPAWSGWPSRHRTACSSSRHRRARFRSRRTRPTYRASSR